MRKRIALAALGAAALTTACAPTRLVVKQEFWQDRQVRIGVALAPKPDAGAHKVGAQGLLDMAINAGMASDLKAHLQTVNIVEFVAVRDRFVQELGKRGMNVVALADVVDPSKFPDWAEGGAPKVENAYDRDLSKLRTEQKVDAVVLLQIRRYGTIRSYYGFIPLGAPAGFFEVKGQMIDLRTGALLWQTQMPEAQATVPASGDWDQPPAYPNLTAALRTAISNGNEFLWKEFFFPDAAPATPPAQTPAPAAPVATTGS